MISNLKSHAQKLKHLRQLFGEDPSRAEKLSLKTEHLFFDFSRQRVTAETIRLLIQLADDMKLKDKIRAMFAGKKINRTENRAVLHIALRNLSNIPVLVDGKDVMPDVKSVLAKIEAFSNDVLSGKRAGATGKKLTNIIAIGIGGSYLGSEYLAAACKAYAKKGMDLRFVANVDGTDFAQKMTGIDAEQTLFIIISKTFTTAETMKNAETAKAWMQSKLGAKPDAIKKHFAAVSTAKEKVEAFGIDPENMFGFWDWVGGRFSSASAVGAVPLSLYLGFDQFMRILEGAHWMDQHFLNSPLEKNIPVISGLIDIWNINFLNFRSRALLPYCQALNKLSPHTQQVEMESNGKSVDLDGKPVPFAAGEVVFGEPGTNGQHSFYQLLHQGTQIIPCDFIGFIKPQYPLGEESSSSVNHHQELMTNFFAQPDALAFGKEDANLAKSFPGNRPSTCILLEELTPFTAGLLLSFTEHRAAVKGFVWGINSFDQFGVELGKVLGKNIRSRMLKHHETGALNASGLNPSTARNLRSFLEGRLPT